MGNQICCQQTTSQQRKQQLLFSQLTPPSHIKQSKSQNTDHFQNHLALPGLSQQVHVVLNQQKPFHQYFQSQEGIKVKKFGNDYYCGPIDLIGRPTKIGKMYKQNGSLFIGHFVSGKAQGDCFYVMKDGSYFKGSMKNNTADCQQGYFVSKQLQYKGGFKNNTFYGKGAERVPNSNYQFDGIYQSGRKKQGYMKWGSPPNEFIYQGAFNQNNQFHGRGKLTDLQGKYQGQFQNGEKHGYGIYNYKTKLRYEGFYQHNSKQGEGKIYNNDGTIAYKGIFKNGMPNGKGIATSKNGTQFQTQWKDGIDIRLL